MVSKYEHPPAVSEHAQLKVKISNSELISDQYEIHLFFLNLNGRITSDLIISKDKLKNRPILLNLNQKIAHIMLKIQHKTERTPYHARLRRLNPECFHSSLFDKHPDCQNSMDYWQEIQVRGEVWIDFIEPFHLQLDLTPKLAEEFLLHCSIQKDKSIKTNSLDPITGVRYFYEQPYPIQHQTVCSFRKTSQPGF
ncbi:MAG: hypothetical protein HQM13_01910 [SAR324 cluster bacterium]|nr:hypothetical protein [SAR324 cluster bacterium]